MGKKSALEKTYSRVAVLEPISKTQLHGRELVRVAKARFADLNDPRLIEVVEDWEVRDVLSRMHTDYNCSVHREDAAVATRLRNFITKHCPQ